MKRKYFSREDGTTFSEDMNALFQEARAKFWELIRKHGDTAEDIINILKAVNDFIKQGTPADMIMDKLAIQFPNFVGTEIFEFIQNRLPSFIEKAENFLQNIGIDIEAEANYESLRHKTASICLQDYLATKDVAIARVDADSVIQEVYRLSVIADNVG